jgi:hypothetical protein
VVATLESVDQADLQGDILAEALLLQGYTYRLWAEFRCETDYESEWNVGDFEREAITAFTTAISAATSAQQNHLAIAARAGRASVHLRLGDYAAAVADAAQVPTDFSYEMPYRDDGVDAHANRIYVATSGNPHRAHTVWSTWVGGDGDQSEPIGQSEENPDGDPRLPFRTTTEVGDSPIECCGQVPWWPQTKYTSADAPITFSSGTEMRLIQAEVQWRNGDLQSARSAINDVRFYHGLEPVEITLDFQGVGQYLVHELGAELWLEGRRLTTLQRLGFLNVNSLRPLERLSDDVYSGSHQVMRVGCFPLQW